MRFQSARRALLGLWKGVLCFAVASVSGIARLRDLQITSAFGRNDFGGLAAIRKPVLPQLAGIELMRPITLLFSAVAGRILRLASGVQADEGVSQTGNGSKVAVAAVNRNDLTGTNERITSVR